MSAGTRHVRFADSEHLDWLEWLNRASRVISLVRSCSERQNPIPWNSMRFLSPPRDTLAERLEHSLHMFYQAKQMLSDEIEYLPASQVPAYKNGTARMEALIDKNIWHHGPSHTNPRTKRVTRTIKKYQSKGVTDLAKERMKNAIKTIKAFSVFIDGPTVADLDQQIPEQEQDTKPKVKPKRELSMIPEVMSQLEVDSNSELDPSMNETRSPEPTPNAGPRSTPEPKLNSLSKQESKSKLDSRPNSASKQVDSRPNSASKQVDSRPNSASKQVDSRPNSASKQVDSRPNSASKQVDSRPNSASKQVDSRPNSAPKQVDSRPNSAPKQVDSRPNSASKKDSKSNLDAKPKKPRVHLNKPVRVKRSPAQVIMDDVFKMASESEKNAPRRVVVNKAITNILKDIDSVHWYMDYLEKRAGKVREGVRAIDQEVNDANWRNLIAAEEEERVDLEEFESKREEKLTRLKKIRQQCERTEKTMYVLWDILHAIITD